MKLVREKRRLLEKVFDERFLLNDTNNLLLKIYAWKVFGCKKCFLDVDLDLDFKET